jgi:hypothetical protein
LFVFLFPKTRFVKRFEWKPGFLDFDSRLLPRLFSSDWSVGVSPSMEKEKRLKLVGFRENKKGARLLGFILTSIPR